jgi:hypothetical protein
LSAVADLLLEELGLLLDWTESVLDGIVGGAEVGGDVANVDLEGLSVVFEQDGCLRLGLGEPTFTPEAMIAATSFCQTSTVSQESLPEPAMVGCVCGRGCGI